MQIYPNYLPMNNYIPSYQQNMLSAQMSGTSQQSNSYLGKMVDSVDAVKATDIPMDGNMYYFPKADGTVIFGKQWLANGTTRILTYKPCFDDNMNNLPQSEEKRKFDLSDESIGVFMQRFDALETRIDDFINRKSSRTKKESDAE